MDSLLEVIYIGPVNGQGPADYKEPRSYFDIFCVLCSKNTHEGIAVSTPSAIATARSHARDEHQINNAPVALLNADSASRSLAASTASAPAPGPPTDDLTQKLGKIVADIDEQRHLAEILLELSADVDDAPDPALWPSHILVCVADTAGFFFSDVEDRRCPICGMGLLEVEMYDDGPADDDDAQEAGDGEES